jgi:hypothetical protein
VLAKGISAGRSTTLQTILLLLSQQSYAAPIGYICHIFISLKKGDGFLDLTNKGGSKHYFVKQVSRKCSRSSSSCQKEDDDAYILLNLALLHKAHLEV